MNVIFEYYVARPAKIVHKLLHPKGYYALCGLILFLWLVYSVFPDDPRPGEVWANCPDNPFMEHECKTAVIIEVRDNYVAYKMPNEDKDTTYSWGLNSFRNKYYKLETD